MLTAAVVATPIVGVTASLLHPAREIWAHLWQTQLIELIGNTLALLAGVGTGTLVLGAGLAWLVVAHEFPGRRALEWALVLPMALPAYVLGFVLLGLLDYAGPLQSWVRGLLGPSAQLPDPRSGWGVMTAMVLVLYPYVYVLARTAFAQEVPEALESARALGRSPGRAFLAVSLPLARPALAAGTALACMEALADFGTVATFGYRTLTEAIYRVWHGMFDRLAATQLAVILLGAAGLLLALERLSRGRARFTQGRRPGHQPARRRLTGARAWAASLGCGLILTLAFALPVAQLLVWGWRVARRDGLPPDFGAHLGASLSLAATAAALATALATLLAYALRLRPGGLAALAVRIATLGYALPGAVVAVGVLIPLGRLDTLLSDLIQRLTASETGLLLTGSLGALVLAYVVRFLAVSFQTVEAGLARVPRRLDEVARTLGAGPGRTLARIHLPLVQRGLLAAAILVFVDVMKELPATILLRPLGLETLAIAIWQRTSESLWEEAAVPALTLVLAGLGPVILVMRMQSPAKPAPDRP